MQNIKKYFMTLALLLTAVTGAWAITDPNSVYWDNQTWKGWTDSETTHTVGDITITCSGNAKAYESTGSGEPLTLQAGANDAITFTSNGKPFASVAIQTGGEVNVAGWTYNSSTWSIEWSGEPTTSVTLSGCNIEADVITFTFGTAEPAITVEPGSSANTWTFTMPGSDVVLTPIYAKAAAFATTGTEPEATTLLPAAAEGVIAGTDASLIAEGTGIVAFAGTSTEVTQGTLMYAIGNSATEAPALTAFSATVPTAKDYDDAATVYVWYYIQGADAPEGVAATLDNTFDDTEPACLTVTVLTNKFDITLKAANANTIEAGKATVKVGGTDKTATVTDGKLQGVKMGSEVKLEAKPGYKFRKVEVKKGAAIPVTSITLNKTETSIKVGATETLSVTSVLPEEATDKTYTWKTSDESKATVDQDGKVTAVAAGTVTIYAEANDGSGVKGNCTVTVTPAVPEYYNKLTKINDNFDDQVDVLKGLGRGYQAYNSSLTAAQAYALATYQAAIDGKAVYVIMSSQNSGYQIHYAVSTDASATEHTSELYDICNDSNPVRMYYVAQ